MLLNVTFWRVRSIENALKLLGSALIRWSNDIVLSTRVRLQ
jgi:hypothetical protein